MNARRCVLLLAAALAPIAAPAQAKRVRVAVLEIRALGTETTKAELLSEVALTEAASMRGFEVIGRSDINSLIGFEKQKQVMGCSDDSTCLAEVGGALGVDYIMVGSLGKLGSLYRIDLKLVETKKARVRGRIGATVDGQEEKLVAAIQKAVRDLLLPHAPAEDAQVARVAPAKPAKEPARAEPKLQSRPEKVVPGDGERSLVAPPRSDPAPSRGAGGLSRRTWAYAAGGAGLALVLGGAVAGLSAGSAYDGEKSAAAAGDLAAYEDSKSRAKSMALVADGLYVGGLAGLGIGTWLWLTSRPARVALDVAPLPGGAVATVSGGF